MSSRDNSRSFSQKVKDELIALEIKKKCCKRAFDDAVSLRDTDKAPAFALSSVPLVCEKCSARFAAGLFVAFGSITDPEKAHHMEFSFPDEKMRDEARVFLSDIGFAPAVTKRKGRFIAYYKKIDTIVDFLGTIGANNSMFDYLNSRIVDSIRNDTNRRVNFDNANIKRTLNATKVQLDVITLIKEHGLFNELSADLRETAELRLEYPESTLADLGLNFRRREVFECP